MIGARIKEFRLKAGLKGKEFARIIGVSQGTLSDIENGKTKPSADTLALIVRHTEIDPVWLLTGADQREDIPVLDDLDNKILQLLDGMEEDKKRDVLRYLEEKKLLTDLLRERKKKGAA